MLSRGMGAMLLLSVRQTKCIAPMGRSYRGGIPEGIAPMRRSYGQAVSQKG